MRVATSSSTRRLGGVAAWPLVARAQQAAMPVIGYMEAGSAEPNAPFLAAFRKGLSETGYVEGRNVAIEFCWAQGQTDRLQECAADLVRRKVSVIVTGDGARTALAAKAATATIPIVFMSGIDPVDAGLVAGLDRPGGNVTGITHMSTQTEAKRLALLHELAPGAVRFAVLVPTRNSRGNPGSTIATDLQAAASAIGGQIEILAASTSREIDAAFESLEQKRTEALLISPAALIDRRAQILTLATRYGLPTIFAWGADAVAGGLISYGIVLTDQFRQVGIYTGRLLKGEKPAALPVMRPTKFELVINLKTAKALGITIPETLLATADEVVQ
jgi:putative tryptophan/tyrosine transport system substrate-binding protein